MVEKCKCGADPDHTTDRIGWHAYECCQCKIWTGWKPTIEDAGQVWDKSAVVDTDNGNKQVTVPRWVLDVLADELAGHTTCGGENDEPGCPRCDAIRIAKEVSASAFLATP